MSLRRRLRAVSVSLAAVLVVLVLAGCGASETSQVRAKVRQFATAAHSHDYATICSNVLAPELLADIASGGISCPKALKLALGSVRGARLVIGTITVNGLRASVVTITQAKGEKTSLATLELTKVSTGWRIASLGNAAAS
jgi:outer membrane lipopolysaccharide assembly protein LptE/RlpB